MFSRSHVQNRGRSNTPRVVKGTCSEVRKVTYIHYLLQSIAMIKHVKQVYLEKHRKTTRNGRIIFRLIEQFNAKI